MNVKQLVISIMTAAVKIAVAVFIINFVIKTATAAYDFGYRVFTEEPVSSPPGVSYTITLTEETTPKQVAETLQENGLIRDSNLFYVQYLSSAYKDKLQPGDYELTTAMTAEEMLEIMSPDVEEPEEEE